MGNKPKTAPLWCQMITIVMAPGALLLRLANLLAIVAHGFGHALALLLVTGDLHALTAKIILEGNGFPALLKSILPHQTLPQFSTNPPQISACLASPWQCRVVAAGGIVMNILSIIVALALISALPNIYSVSPLLAVFVRAALITFCLASFLAMLSLPDLLSFLRGIPVWACGPAFAIRYKLDDAKQPSTLVSERLLDMIEVLAREASTRGGQSAGFSIIVDKEDAQSIIFDKVVKGKRQDIVKVIKEKLLALLDKAGSEGFKRSPGFEAILLHLRYATGGATHWHNAQPHWYEYFDAMMHHRVEHGQLVSQPREVFNMIAHNGDFDAVYLDCKVDGQRIRHYFTQGEARGFFQLAMPWSSSQGNSDSRSVAEWVDFHLTQGLAYKALRYTYFTAALDFNRDILGKNFKLETLQKWADSVDLVLLNAAKDQTSILLPDARSIAELHPDVKTTLRETLTKELRQTFDTDTTRTFLDIFEEAFFQHDLTWVMRYASKNLIGEFALMVCTTLEPRMGVFSLTQAFSLGVNRTRGEIFGSAEPQGVTSALHQGEPGDDALQINLEDGQYATVEYIVQKNKPAILIYDRASENDDLAVYPTPVPAALLTSNKHMATAWFPVNKNPKITRATRQDTPGEEVPRDLREIPYILRRIVASFEPQGENFATLNHFSELLFANFRDPARDLKKFDLVLFGVDFNQDLIGEFAIALQAVLPDLKVRTENSGNVLKEMKRTKREGIGGYGPKTIFLGVSNSAQTQSTLAAVRKAVELVGTERCFVITQNFLNSMSQALGQGYRTIDPILPNTFVNLSHLSPDNTCGRRRSEAATIVRVATHAVLTEILIGVTQRALLSRRALPDKSAQTVPLALRHDLQMTDVMAFREFQSAIYDVEVPNRIGYNAAGEQIDAPDREVIEKEAQARAENQFEFVRSYAIFAAYIVAATLFGIPVFAVLSAPFQFITGVGFIAHILDAALFLSALWLIHLGIRRSQGRPLLERIGARAELYIDRKYIARMIERYNATLFSNAPAFVTPYFYWADTVQDALHRFGIRAHRGVVTIHRTPDERMGIEEANNAAEENMVFAQIGGIRFNFGQPQSRDKVRYNSRYMNRGSADQAARPYQTVLSDSLEHLRQKYNQKLSPETFRLINRRLIDLSDGLIVEFMIGYRRREILNQSVWGVVKWLPFAHWIYRIFLHNGIDLKNIMGDADTANQAQIQSTKHPVSPHDINAETMEPRLTFDALVGQEHIQDDEPLAILVFFESYLSISLNSHPLLQQEHTRPPEILLRPGKGAEQGKLVCNCIDERVGRFVATIQLIDGEEVLVIDNAKNNFQISLPLSQLTDEQRYYLKYRLNVETNYELAIAA